MLDNLYRVIPPGLVFMCICTALVYIRYFPMQQNDDVPQFDKAIKTSEDFRRVDDRNENGWCAELLRGYKNIWKAANDFKNYWFYVRVNINGSHLSNGKGNIDDGYMTISNELEVAMERTKELRSRKLQQLSDCIQDRITKLQHPPDCQRARLLVSDMSHLRCGFGCCTHNVISLLMTAIQTNRTLVLRSKGWKYAEYGWEYLFLPLSNCSHAGDLTKLPKIVVAKAGNVDEPRVMSSYENTTTRISTAIPQNFENLQKLHGNPVDWWIGQFAAYATRLQPWFQKELSELERTIGFTNDTVGLQIRWGDKIRKEALKHSVEEHMLYVEQWYKKREMGGEQLQRVVFLATEDVSARQEAIKKYPSYRFINATSYCKEFSLRERYTNEGLKNVLKDIYFLSRSRYLVCTLSSNVCRTAYELMLSQKADASIAFQSVDSLYRFWRRSRKMFVALTDHSPEFSEELEFSKGDNLSISVDPRLPSNDGFYRGKNIRTGKGGLIPTFKVQERIQTRAL